MASVKYKCGLIVMQGMDGKVIVSPKREHFKDEVERETTAEDAIYMFRTALLELEQEQLLEKLAAVLRG